MTRPDMLVCATTLATVCWLIASPAPAHATRVLKYDIQSAESFVITAYADQDTVLAFPSAVEYAVVPDMSRTPAHADFVPYSHEVKLVPTRNGAGGEGALTIITEKHRLKLLLNIVVREATEAYDRIEFYDGHAERKFLQEQCQRRFKTAFAHLSFKGFQEIPLRHDPGGSQGIELRNLRVVRLADHHQFLFAIANHHHDVLPIQTIRLLDGNRQSEHTEFIEIDAASSDPNLIAEIPKGKIVAVFLAVDDIEHLGPTAYLEIVTTHGIPLTTKTIYPFGDPYKEDPPNKGRLSIQAQAMGGAIILEPRAPDASGTDVTSLRGVGVRALYGVSRHLSLETSLSVLSTGQARFDNDISGEATLARLLVGATLQAGEKYVPYARLATGAVATFYRSLPNDGSSTSHFSSDALFSIGAGLDTWLGERFVMGLSASYVDPFDSKEASFEAGIYVGYAWKP